MQNYIYKGASSLFLIISTIKAFYSSDLLWWKLANLLLVPSSYLCNINDFKEPYLNIDYIAITLVCCSYINNFLINNALYVLCMLEYKMTDTIHYTKNTAVLTAVIKSLWFTRTVLGLPYAILLISSALIGVLAYITILSVEKNNIREPCNLSIIYIFHFSIMIVIYISSITAIK